MLPPRVRYDRELPATGKLLYAEITAMTDVTGFCWASNGYLGRLIGVSKDRASKLVAALEARGYVSVEVLRSEAGAVTERRIWVTDQGRMNLPPVVKNTYTPPGKNTGTPPGKNNEENDKSIEHTPPYNPPKGERSRRNEHRAAPEWKPERFEQLWRWYPGDPERHAKRGNRQRAIRAWDKLHPDDALIETVAEALERQAASEEWREGVGIPHLSTYLNGYGWEGWESQ